MASSPSDQSKVLYLHRGFVGRPSQPEPHRQVADLSEWLNRPKRSPLLDDLRDFAADIREHSDIAIFCLTIGICAGALATVAFALVWSAF
jgi:hypothetical protein